jgi:hypothetical protein
MYGIRDVDAKTTLVLSRKNHGFCPQLCKLVLDSVLTRFLRQVCLWCRYITFSLCFYLCKKTCFCSDFNFENHVVGYTGTNKPLLYYNWIVDSVTTSHVS